MFPEYSFSGMKRLRVVCTYTTYSHCFVTLPYSDKLNRLLLGPKVHQASKTPRVLEPRHLNLLENGSLFGALSIRVKTVRNSRQVEQYKFSITNMKRDKCVPFVCI